MLSRILKPKNPRVDLDRFRRVVDRAETSVLHLVTVMGFLNLLDWALRSFGDWKNLVLRALMVLVVLPLLQFPLAFMMIAGQDAEKGRSMLRPQVDPGADDASGPT